MNNVLRPGHTRGQRDIAFPADQHRLDGGAVKTVLVEFVEETRHRVRLQVPADCDLEGIEAALPNILAADNLDGFVDLLRHIERVEILDDPSSAPTTSF